MDKSVRVFCRFRPIGNEESSPLTLTDEEVKIVGKRNEMHTYHYDHVFNQTSTQENVYEIVAQPLIEEILKGFNVTIFSYGQSGSGKTATMSGCTRNDDGVVVWDEQMGIIPRMMRDLFSVMKSNTECKYSIQLSYVEIYLERIRDLLNPDHDNLEIRDTPFKGVWIDKVTDVYVGCFEEAAKVIRRGDVNRSVASTGMNLHSSRSHSLLIVNMTSITAEAKNQSRIIFVDLAGSEKVERTKAEGIILKQAQSTNKSLMTLGVVIRALYEEKSHIPYRDSKLTRLLTDSLGGNSKTSLIITCSPALINLEETISTLRFGEITQGIKNRPQVNQDLSIEEYKRLLALATSKIESISSGNDSEKCLLLQSQNDNLIERIGELRDHYDQKSQDYENKNSEVEELRSKIESYHQADEIARELDAAMKAKIISLTEETRTIRQASLSLPRPQEVVNLTPRLEDTTDYKSLYDSKVRHIQILEESLSTSNLQLQQLVSEHKLKFITQEKRIKDLESQIRVMKKNITPPSNVFKPYV